MSELSFWDSWGRLDEGGSEWGLTVLLFLALSGGGAFGGLADTAGMVGRSIVAVGTFQAMRRPPSVFLGTGFAVADGRHILTNAHVLPEKLDKAHRGSSRRFRRPRLRGEGS